MGLRKARAEKYAHDLVLTHQVASDAALKIFCQRNNLSILGMTALEIDIVHNSLGLTGKNTILPPPSPSQAPSFSNGDIYLLIRSQISD